MSAAGPAGEAEREPIRIVLADDQRLVRESLGTLLGLLSGIELVASAADGEEALALTEQHRPDVVLMDLRMPRLDGIEATRELRKRFPDVGVIALTTYADDESVLGALRAGARGYLTKDASSEDIRAAILTVAAGDIRTDPPCSTTSSTRSGATANLTGMASAQASAQTCPMTSRHARPRYWP